MPDDPGDALKYVSAFLPGFVGLGLACYLVDLRFDEFYFAFIAIALSAASYGVAVVVIAACKKGRPWPWIRRKWPGLAAWLASAKTVIANVIALISAVALAAVNRLPDVNITKTSSQRPLLYVISHLENCASARRLDAREDMTKMPTQTLLRIAIKDYGTVEGFVRVAPTELDPDEVYLSPACHITGDVVTPVPGPGILVKTDNALAVELVDASASKCWALHYPEPPCVCPPPEIVKKPERLAKYMERINAALPPDRQHKPCKDGR
jgi:hypothetical protein